MGPDDPLGPFGTERESMTDRSIELVPEHWNQQHGQWCRHLRHLGMLNEAHEICARIHDHDK